jgi:hypothetical protein
MIQVESALRTSNHFLALQHVVEFSEIGRINFVTVTVSVATAQPGPLTARLRQLSGSHQRDPGNGPPRAG